MVVMVVKKLADSHDKKMMPVVMNMQAKHEDVALVSWPESQIC